MKMWILIKREILIFVPKMVIVFFLLQLLGMAELVQMQRSPFEYRGNGSNIILSDLALHHPPLQNFVGIFQTACIGLGIWAAWMQFGQTGWRREWGFLLHRPIRRWQLTLSKMIGAMAPVLVIPWAVWFLIWRAAVQMPWWEFDAHQLYEGWQFALWGYAAYLATALTIMDRTAWIVRRSLPLVTLLITCVILQDGIWSLTVAFMICGGFLVLLAPQLFMCMERREFS